MVDFNPPTSFSHQRPKEVGVVARANVEEVLLFLFSFYFWVLFSYLLFGTDKMAVKGVEDNIEAIIHFVNLFLEGAGLLFSFIHLFLEFVFFIEFFYH